MTEIEALSAAFRRRFGGEPVFFRAPGRVNLIGEHTDYNDGFVMPAAIEYEFIAAARGRGDGRIRLHSLNTGADAEFDLADAAPMPRHDWSDYAFGVAVMLRRAGYQVGGADIAVSSTVPIGSGLSSSAAFEVVIGSALMSLSGLAIEPVALALTCQKAENEYVGMRCGIMDQFISCLGVKDHALMIDCRSLSARAVPLDRRVRIVVANSMVHHAHAGGEYNKRRLSCEEGVRAIASSTSRGIAALRDVSLAVLEAHRGHLSDETFRRCRHVVTENARVVAAADALEHGHLEHFGVLMDLSHASMRDDYEITCNEVDLLVDIGRKQPGVYGSRMTGGGFGGCTVSLVEADAVADFIAAVGIEYNQATGLDPAIFACSPAAGAGPLVP